MSDLIYEASVYHRTITYKNFKGETQTVDLYFALDPLQLMSVMATVETKKVRSGNPAINGKDAEITDEAQIKMVRDLAVRSAGTPSEDGETWLPFENFDQTIAGKAFLTKLASSDSDRREFSEKVILAPFRAFVNYAIADESNSAKDKQQFKTMLTQMENIFKEPETPGETIEERRARLAKELETLGDSE